MKDSRITRIMANKRTPPTIKEIQAVVPTELLTPIIDYARNGGNIMITTANWSGWHTLAILEIPNRPGMTKVSLYYGIATWLANFLECSGDQSSFLKPVAKS